MGRRYSGDHQAGEVQKMMNYRHKLFRFLLVQSKASAKSMDDNAAQLRRRDKRSRIRASWYHVYDESDFARTSMVRSGLQDGLTEPKILFPVVHTIFRYRDCYGVYQSQVLLDTSGGWKVVTEELT